jgi:hypothetical protein
METLVVGNAGVITGRLVCHEGGKKGPLEGKWTENSVKQKKRNQGWGYKNCNTKETIGRRQERITTFVVRKAWLSLSCHCGKIAETLIEKN